MQFHWIGSHSENPTNLNTNNASAVTGDSTFVSSENLWNNPANWAYAINHNTLTQAWNRYPVAGDIAQFRGFTGASVDGVEHYSLPLSECLYGGISSDGAWYDEGIVKVL